MDWQRILVFLVKTLYFIIKWGIRLAFLCLFFPLFIAGLLLGGVGIDNDRDYLHRRYR